MGRSLDLHCNGESASVMPALFALLHSHERTPPTCLYDDDHDHDPKV